MRSKVFLRASTHFCLPIIVVLVSVNFFGDAANLFRVGIERDIASALSRGRNVTKISNFDERLLQKELISSFQSAPTVVVLGSSRTMQIATRHFGEMPFFNHSVSGATLEDFMSILQLYENSQLKLQRVIVCLDPWVLNDNHSQTRWKTIGLEAQLFMNRGGDRPEFASASDMASYDKLRQLFSLSYFQSSFRSLLRGNAGFDTVATRENLDMTRLTDGSLVYGKQIRDIDAVTVEEAARKMTHGKLYNCELFHELSKTYSSHLKKVILYAEEKAIQLNFILLPFHPLVYDHILATEKYKNVLIAEQYFVALAKTHNIPIYGSYDPAKVNLRSDDFFDGMHLKKDGINKMMSKFLLQTRVL